MTWTGAGALDVCSGTVFNNGGILSIQNSASWTASSGTPSVCNDAGTFRKVGDTNLSSLRIWFTNSGRLEASSGTLDFSSGTYVGRSNSLIAGSASLKGNFPQAGGTSPGESPGLLRILGNFTQTNTSALSIEIGSLVPGTNFDQLAISSSAVLGGTLNLVLTHGFLPALGDTFPILTCAARTNTFAIVNGTAVGNGLVLVPTYTTTNVTLKTVHVPVLKSPVHHGHRPCMIEPFP